MSAPAIKSRKPTGQVPWPLILLEGPEGAGKSLIPVVLSTSERVGTFYWIDLGEGAADEYAALPGSNYEVIEHDGSYRDILEQITAVWHEAERAQVAGEPPVGIVVDSMSAEWTMLVNWTNDRARRSRNGQKKLAEDPDAEIDPTSNLWNDANKRHKRIMDLLMTFPGIALVTARGKEVAVMGPNGQPIEGRKEWKVEGQKNLGYDVTAWVRVQREPRRSDLIKVRSLRMQVPTGQTVELPTRKVGEWDVLDLEKFIFEWLGCTGETKPRDLQQLRGDDLEGLFDEISGTPTEAALQAVWVRVRDGLTPDQRQGVLEAVNRHLETLRKGPHTQTPADGPAAAEQPADGPTGDAAKLKAAAERKAAEEEPAA